jgi:hypothetical protein
LSLPGSHSFEIVPAKDQSRTSVPLLGTLCISSLAYRYRSVILSAYKSVSGVHLTVTAVTAVTAEFSHIESHKTFSGV